MFDLIKRQFLIVSNSINIFDLIIYTNRIKI